MADNHDPSNAGGLPEDFETQPLTPTPHSAPASGTNRPATSTGEEPTPDHIGPYTITDVLGKGGVGVVYLGIRDAGGVRTRVAVKVLRRGMDTEDLLRRFELERKLLAALEHPYIARLLDAGATEDGRPYFVMEHIRGKPIDRYCDDHRLSIADRIELFRKVCEAVHFAHQNLVVHRDLKPGNILVTDTGEPKLVDFGIAKLLNPGLVSADYEPTAAYVRLMTPEYASPEQVTGENVSTSSDIYSLGVVLFELLTGRRPYRLQSRVLEEVKRVICEEAPERPSTAITRADLPSKTGQPATSKPRSGPLTSGDPSTAKRDTERLAKRLSGDLDNIVLMALRKEPSRRYRSAQQLSEDLDRHLKNYPVVARPDTLVYRSRKFVERNRVGVVAGGLVAASLAIGLVGTAYSANQAARARDAEAVQRASAERLAVDLRDALTTLAGDVDSAMQTRGSVEARRLLFEGSRERLERLEQGHPDDGALQRDLAFVRERLGDALGGIRSGNAGERDAALAQYEAALATRERLLARTPDSAPLAGEVASALIKTGDMFRETGKTEPALERYTRAVAILDAIPPESRTADTHRRQLAANLSAGQTLERLGKQAEARLAYEGALVAAERTLAGDSLNESARRDRSVALIALGDLSNRAGDLEDARRRYGAAVQDRRALAAAHPDGARQKRDLAVALYSIASVRLAMGDAPAAIDSLDEAVTLVDALLVEDPGDARLRRDASIYRGRLAEALHANAQTARAIEIQRAVIADSEALAAASPENLSLARSVGVQRNRLGIMLLDSGRNADALAQFELAETVAADLARRDPANAVYQRDLCYTLTLLSRAAIAQAESSTSPAQRAPLLTRARGFSERGLTVLEQLETRGQTRGDEPQIRAQIGELLARVDEMGAGN